jgi:hypothetical protein
MSDFAWFCLMMIVMTLAMYASDIIQAWHGRSDDEQ